MIDIDIEEVTTVDALETLRPEWSALYERCAGATPFQSPEWLLSWWKYFGAGELWVLALRRAGAMVGLAPFFLGAWGERGLRYLWLIGTGITDRLDLLLEPGLESIGGARIVDHLLRRRDRWDLADFQELGADSPLLTASSTCSLPYRIVPQSVSPRLCLPEGRIPFQKVLSPIHGRNLRRARRRLEGAGPFHFEQADEQSLPGLLDALFLLHENRWEKREGSGVLGDPTIRAFHREAASGFLKRSALRLDALRFKETIVATLYAFQKGSVLYCYLSGFDSERAYYSPGAILLEHVIEAAIRSGLREVDFLRGEEPYKYLWGATDRSQYRIWMSPDAERLPSPPERIEKAG